MTRYVLRSKKTDKFIALDPPSGNYPYEVDDPLDAGFWRDKASAIKYTAVFSHQDYDNPPYEILEIDVFLTPVEMPTGKDLSSHR